MSESEILQLHIDKLDLLPSHERVLKEALQSVAANDSPANDAVDLLMEIIDKGQDILSSLTADLAHEVLHEQITKITSTGSPL